MKDKSLVVQKIPKCYVGEDCIQIMFPFTESIIVCEKEAVLTEEYIRCCYDVNDRNGDVINKYLEDERKNTFPYSNIPVHTSRNGFKKVYYVNQLLNFDEDYYCIVDRELYTEDEGGYECSLGYFIHAYLIKDNDDVLLVSQYYCLDVFDKYDRYKKDLLKSKYTLTEIKGFTPTKIRKSSNPRFGLGLNPNIDKKEIKKAKTLVRSMNKR